MMGCIFDLLMIALLLPLWILSFPLHLLAFVTEPVPLVGRFFKWLYMLEEFVWYVHMLPIGEYSKVKANIVLARSFGGTNGDLYNWIADVNDYWFKQ